MQNALRARHYFTGGVPAFFFFFYAAESKMKPYLHKTLAVPQLLSYVQLGTKEQALICLLCVFLSSSASQTKHPGQRRGASSALLRTNTSSNRRCFSSSPVFFFHPSLPPCISACVRACVRTLKPVGCGRSEASRRGSKGAIRSCEITLKHVASS